MKVIILLALQLGAASLLCQTGLFRTTVGQQVPEFQMTTVEGQQFSISDLKGKIVLINLFGTRCRECLKKLPKLNERLAQRLDPDKFILLTVGCTDDMESLKAFSNSHDYNTTYVPDPEQDIFELFAEFELPRNIVLDKNGKIIFQAYGQNHTPFENMISLIKRKVSEL